jgi:Protein of unknown function (DUF2442)
LIRLRALRRDKEGLTQSDGELSLIMLHPTSVKALPVNRIFIRYSDGTEGEIDLAEFASKKLFAAWKDPPFFQKVQIGPYRQIRWSDEIELCSDALYLKLTGQTPDEFFVRSAAAPTHA